jgi:hypothetical protein
MWLRLKHMGQSTNGFAQAHGKIYDGAKALNIRYEHSVFHEPGQVQHCPESPLEGY